MPTPKPIDPNATNWARTLLLITAGLVLSACGDAQPGESPEAVKAADAQRAAQERHENVSSLRTRQHEISTVVAKADAEMIEMGDSTMVWRPLEAFLSLPEEMKVAKLRKGLVEHRRNLGLDPNHFMHKDAKVMVPLIEARLRLHDELVEVERRLAALGEKP